MAELKTKLNEASVDEFLNTIEDPNKKADSLKIHQIMQQVTGEKGAMWGTSIVGYGQYHYVGASGREGDWMATGFSPRKNAISIYIMAGFKHYDDLMKKLGKFKTGVGCLYVKKLDDVDEKVLRELIGESFKFITRKK